ncbi:PPC domain-containing protein, partial [Candidatus Bipolaricaulota bacterium]|nr:PPC domain-containing protein [Candidatus Bipolaricaulota bacterium]
MSPPNDPLGYTCRGVVTISRSAFPAASALVFRVERTSPDANHIAFNKESIVILAPGAEHETEEQNDAGSGHDASDERKGALPLLPGTYQGFLEDDDDYDWYSFNADKGQIISLKLVPQTGDFDLYLYRGDSGSSVAHSNHGTGQEEAIQYVAGQSGTWYIRVKRNSGEGEYTLTVAPPSYQASKFDSTGDLIDTWNWLRDDALQQSAEWTFEGIAPAAPILTVEITLLASSIITGPTEVHFLLIVGPPGAATFWSQEVSLPVVGPAAGAAEFRCQGIVQIPRSLQYGTDQSNLIFRVQRVSPDAPRIAFQEDSVIVQTVQEETALEAELRTVTADGFQGNGDLIRGSYWCRRAGQFLEWTWEPIGESQQLTEAAVNLNLLVTNTFDGGSGFSAVVPVAVFDLSGKVVESGLVNLVNTFKPRFTGDSGGIGYAASGSYELKYPEIILDG